MNKPGDLSVWWVPQVPMQAFRVPVASVAMGVKLLEVLADYDSFEFENNVKPDYCNAGGLMQFDADIADWRDWEGDLGEDFDEVRHDPEFIAAVGEG
jgi:hypothetical protein